MPLERLLILVCFEKFMSGFSAMPLFLLGLICLGEC